MKECIGCCWFLYTSAVINAIGFPQPHTPACHKPIGVPTASLFNHGDKNRSLSPVPN